MKRHSLGEFEHLVLLAILRLGDRAYGVPIAAELTERTGREVAHASVYLTLRRLEKKGWVSSRSGNPTPRRGGRAKRYFRLEPTGLDKLSRSRAALLKMWDGVGAVLDGRSKP